MDAAMKLLDRQGYTEQQLRVKLQRAAFTEAAVEDCLLRLKTWGYLNDRIYGEERIRLLQNRCKSREYIRYDLEGNGLMPALAEELLSRFYPPDMELEIARKLLGKRFGRREKSFSESDETTPQSTALKAASAQASSKTASAKAVSAKAAASLARAGFAEETIRSCFPNGLPAISST